MKKIVLRYTPSCQISTKLLNWFSLQLDNILVAKVFFFNIHIFDKVEGPKKNLVAKHQKHFFEHSIYLHIVSDL